MTEEIGPADPPAAAADVFGDALPLAEQYAALLAGPGVERGVVGPDEAARIWDRHLLNCAAIVRLIPAKSFVADVGSGAGLPGIVVAMLLPSARVTLIESLARRVAFLEECVAELGLANVEVVRARAEDLAGEIVAEHQCLHWRPPSVEGEMPSDLATRLLCQAASPWARASAHARLR